MPIADYNGTTWNTLKKVEDYNGTTNNLLKRVDDYNGTTWNIIHQSELQIVPGISSDFKMVTNNSSCQARLESTGAITMVGDVDNDSDSTYAYGMVRTTSPIDFSQYSTLTITGNAYKYDGYDTRGHIRVAGKTTAKNSISGYAASSSGTVCTETWDWGSKSLMTTGGSNSFSQTYDISNVTGTYYLYFWCASCAWFSTSMTVESCIFK